MRPSGLDLQAKFMDQFNRRNRTRPARYVKIYCDPKYFLIVI